jgi:hypothetical protein
MARGRDRASQSSTNTRHSDRYRSSDRNYSPWQVYARAGSARPSPLASHHAVRSERSRLVVTILHSRTDRIKDTAYHCCGSFNPLLHRTKPRSPPMCRRPGSLGGLVEVFLETLAPRRIRILRTRLLPDYMNAERYISTHQRAPRRNDSETLWKWINRARFRYSWNITFTAFATTPGLELGR